MSKVNFKIFIKDMIQFMIILVALDLLWSGIEMLFDGGVTNTISDTIMGIALALFINKEINNYKMERLLLANLKRMRAELENISGEEKK